MPRLRLALVPAAALLAVGCSGPQPEALKVAIPYDAPGLSLVVQGEEVGIGTQVARQGAVALGATQRDDLLLTQATERTVGADVAAHGVRFAVGSTDLPADRASQVHAVGPFLTSGLQLAVRPGGPASAAQLQGRPVCVVGGSSAQRRASTVVPAALPTARRSLSTCLSELRDARVDAVLADGITLRGYTRGPAYAAVVVLPQRLTRDDLSLLVPADHPDDCRALTIALRSYVSSGAWARAVQGDLVTPGILDAVPPTPVVRGCD